MTKAKQEKAKREAEHREFRKKHNVTVVENGSFNFDNSCFEKRAKEMKELLKRIGLPPELGLKIE